MAAVRNGLNDRLEDLASRPFDGANIQVIEKLFSETIGKSGSCGLGRLFSGNDEFRKTIVFNGQKHYRKYFANGRYLTLPGEVSASRGIYQSNAEKRSICPLELKLRFINDYVSFAAAEYICHGMAIMTLGEFVRHCEKWMHMKPSEGTVKRVLEYVGRFLESDDFPAGIRSKEPASEEAVTLAMSIDSTSVNIRRQGWRHATSATTSTYNAEGKRLETIYVGRMPETGKRQAKLLLENEVKAKLSRQNFRHVVCIADGAHDFWRFFQTRFPDATHVVDFYHVCEHLSKLSNLLFEDPIRAKAWFEKYRSVLGDDPNGAARLIRAARYRRDLLKKKEAADTEIKYLRRNRKRMNHCQLPRDKLPIGSGVVEAACKSLIGARMKKSGMRWTIEGGQTIPTLRSIILSDRWEKFWSYFVACHFPEIQT